MKKSLAALVVLILAFSVVSAHPLDQYLELAQLGIGRNTITIELRLIPGALVAGKIIELIDADRDGRFSDAEQHRYVSSVLSDLILKVDGRNVPLRISSISFPPKAELEGGSGFIEVHFTSEVDLSAAGRHEVEFLNNHLQGFGTTQVNALTPETPELSIVSQSRDPNQRRLLIGINDGRLSLFSKLEVAILGLVFLALLAFYLFRAYRQAA